MTTLRSKIGHLGSTIIFMASGIELHRHHEIFVLDICPLYN